MKWFPRLKFCGLTREIDVEGAIQAGADAIGLNFYEKSRRFVSIELGSRLSRIAAGHSVRVGVFVNASPETIARHVECCDLDAIQLHGDEEDAWMQAALRWNSIQQRPILRAMAYRGAVDTPDLQYWCRRVNDPCDPVCGLVIDAYDPVERGGTGKTARWDLLYPRPEPFTSGIGSGAESHEERVATERTKVPLILAGGLTEANLREACRTAKPDGIDVASGIESAPGIKDRELMKRFGAIAQQCLGR